MVFLNQSSVQSVAFGIGTLHDATVTVGCSLDMKCGGKSGSFWKFSAWKAQSPTAQSCHDRLNFVCKFFGIVPAFSVSPIRADKKWIFQVLNHLIMIASMMLYIWITQLTIMETVIQKTKSVIMGRIMESIHSHYGLLILVAMLVGQHLHGKSSKIPALLHLTDCQLKRYGNTVDLNSFYRFMNSCLALSIVMSLVLCSFGFMVLEWKEKLPVPVKQAMIISQYVQISYAVMCLHATLTVATISIRFRALNRLLR